jgi:acetyl esterase
MVNQQIEDFITKFLEVRAQCKEMPLPEAREFLDAFSQKNNVNPEPVHEIRDLSVDGVPVRIYIPEGKPPFSAMVYFHSGGWVLGSITESDGVCRTLCKQTRHVIISTGYRLAPEYHFPKGLDDCYKVLRWVKAKAGSLGINPEKIGVAGSSSGGNLAAALALMARDIGEPEIAFQLLFFPVLTSHMDQKVYDACLDKRYLTFEMMSYFWSLYLGQPEDGEHPYASPLKADSFEGLPPALILVAECDPLCAEGEQYAARLQKEGVKVVLRKYPGMIHNFIQMPLDLPEKNEAFRDITKFVRVF